MSERRKYSLHCCSPDIDGKPRQAPQYTVEGTVEHGILAGSEVFFAERDEKLRYDLVKRLVQWIMDTDDNAFYDEAHSDNVVGLTSSQGIRSYVAMLRRDTMDNCLSDELETLHEYLRSVDKDIPEQYLQRYNMVVFGIEGSHEDPYETDRRVERAKRLFEWFGRRQAEW